MKVLLRREGKWILRERWLTIRRRLVKCLKVAATIPGTPAIVSRKRMRWKYISCLPYLKSRRTHIEPSVIIQEVPSFPKFFNTHITARRYLLVLVARDEIEYTSLKYISTSAACRSSWTIPWELNQTVRKLIRQCFGLSVQNLKKNVRKFERIDLRITSNMPLQLWAPPVYIQDEKAPSLLESWWAQCSRHPP